MLDLIQLDKSVQTSKMQKKLHLITCHNMTCGNLITEGIIYLKAVRGPHPGLASWKKRTVQFGEFNQVWEIGSFGCWYQSGFLRRRHQACKLRVMPCAIINFTRESTGSSSTEHRASGLMICDNLGWTSRSGVKNTGALWWTPSDSVESIQHELKHPMRT